MTMMAVASLRLSMVLRILSGTFGIILFFWQCLRNISREYSSLLHVQFMFNVQSTSVVCIIVALFSIQ